MSAIAREEVVHYSGFQDTNYYFFVSLEACILKSRYNVRGKNTSKILGFIYILKFYLTACSKFAL